MRIDLSSTEKHQLNYLIGIYRKENKKTLDDLSGSVCTRQYLSKLENDEIVANSDIYDELLGKLGLEFDYDIEFDYVPVFHNLYESLYYMNDEDTFSIIEDIKRNLQKSNGVIENIYLDICKAIMIHMTNSINITIEELIFLLKRSKILNEETQDLVKFIMYCIAKRIISNGKERMQIIDRYQLFSNPLKLCDTQLAAIYITNNRPLDSMIKLNSDIRKYTDENNINRKGYALSIQLLLVSNNQKKDLDKILEECNYFIKDNKNSINKRVIDNLIFELSLVCYFNERYEDVINCYAYKKTSNELSTLFYNSSCSLLNKQNIIDIKYIEEIKSNYKILQLYFQLIKENNNSENLYEICDEFISNNFLKIGQVSESGPIYLIMKNEIEKVVTVTKNYNLKKKIKLQ